MTPVHLTNPQTFAFSIVMVIAVLLIKGYGHKFISLILQKLYTLFIGDPRHLAPF